MQQVYILSGKRSACGAYGGMLANMSAIDLAKETLQSLIESASFDTAALESITLGHVLSANVGQNPARQVALAAGLSKNICASNVNKVCASGMKAIHILAQDIRTGQVELGVAGGMESMSNVPHYLPQARFGLGFGEKKIIDGLQKDGLSDAIQHQSMGQFADYAAKKYELNREELDDFAERSFRKAIQAHETGAFEAELAPINLQTKKETITVTIDEQISKVNFDKIRSLKPAFTPDGLCTPANSSPMSDGASMLILGNEERAKSAALARIVAYAEAEHNPELFTTAPVSATQKVLKMAGLTLNDIDFFEVNEAFAVVPILLAKQLHVDLAKININGGAIALGHALGNSGSRIVLTLAHILKNNNARYGLATICNGGGGASSIIIEAV